MVGDHHLEVSISLGVASIPDEANTRTVDEFYKHADMALFQSKRQGRNRSTHYDDLSPDERIPQFL